MAPTAAAGAPRPGASSFCSRSATAPAGKRALRMAEAPSSIRGRARASAGSLHWKQRRRRLHAAGPQTAVLAPRAARAQSSAP
eukprot:scaffold8721_cov80-Phaeocystis_antarctica.AAC.33